KFDLEPNSFYQTFSSLQQVTIADVYMNMYGQAQTNSKTQTFTTNGSTISLTIDNSHSTYTAYFDILSGGMSIYHRSVGSNSVDNTTLQLAAGTYDAKIYYLYNVYDPLEAKLSQPQTVVTTSTVLIGGLRVKTITNNDGISANNNIITS